MDCLVRYPSAKPAANAWTWIILKNGVHSSIWLWMLVNLIRESVIGGYLQVHPAIVPLVISEVGPGHHRVVVVDARQDLEVAPDPGNGDGPAGVRHLQTVSRRDEGCDQQWQYYCRDHAAHHTVWETLSLRAVNTETSFSFHFLKMVSKNLQLYLDHAIAQYFLLCSSWKDPFFLQHCHETAWFHKFYFWFFCILKTK